MDKSDGDAVDGVERENFFTLGVIGVPVSGPQELLPVSQNYFRSRDNHFRFD